MATPQESLRYNRDRIYPMAGLNTLYAKSVSEAGYTVLEADYHVEADTTVAAFTISLTLVPYVGEEHRFVDNTGMCAANNLTISGNGNLINGAAFALVNTAFGGITVRWNGTQWIIIARV